MKKTIEQIMRESGFLRMERENAGRIYIEWIKDGLLIDEGDIVEEK